MKAGSNKITRRSVLSNLALGSAAALTASVSGSVAAQVKGPKMKTVVKSQRQIWHRLADNSFVTIIDNTITI